MSTRVNSFAISIVEVSYKEMGTSAIAALGQTFIGTGVWYINHTWKISRKPPHGGFPRLSEVSPGKLFRNAVTNIFLFEKPPHYLCSHGGLSSTP